MFHFCCVNLSLFLVASGRYFSLDRMFGLFECKQNIFAEIRTHIRHCDTLYQSFAIVHEKKNRRWNFIVPKCALNCNRILR